MDRGRKLELFLDTMRKDEFLPLADEYLHCGNYNNEYSINLFKAATGFDFTGKRILEVGFGDGHVMECLTRLGAHVTGIGMDEIYLKKCLDKGMDVHLMDQSFMEFPDNHFDLLWSKHCLEHSIFPFYTIHEYKRVMKPGTLAYVELPGADNGGNYVDDLNHYCVMTMNMWISLFKRAGMTIVNSGEMNLVTVAPGDPRGPGLKQLMLIVKKEAL